MLSFRSFAAGDLETLQRIRAAAFAPVFQSFRNLVGEDIAAIAFATADAEQAKLLEDMCSAGAVAHVTIALVNGEIVGFVSHTIDAETRIGEIGLNAVDPSQAGHGIGSRMYEFALSQMKAMGMKAASVGVGGDDSHAPARRAYEKAGFASGVPSVWLYKLL